MVAAINSSEAETSIDEPDDEVGEVVELLELVVVEVVAAVVVEFEDEAVVLPELFDGDVLLADVLLLEVDPVPDVELLPEVDDVPEFDLPEVDELDVEPDPRIEFRIELRLTIAIPQNDFAGQGVC